MTTFVARVPRKTLYFKVNIKSKFKIEQSELNAFLSEFGALSELAQVRVSHFLVCFERKKR
jgi:hypothetical protein